MKYKKVIFVCMDNTCRSILAEAIMNGVNKDDLITVESRGLVVLFSEPINQRVVPLLKNSNLVPARETSKELCDEDLEEGTLVLTMTEKEKRIAKEKFDYNEIYSIAEFTSQEGDIEEPRGGALADYGACYEYIDFIVKMAAEKLFKQICLGE